MRHSTNRDNSQVTRLNFRNGWTASIVSKGATSECAVWPTSRHPGDDWVDHVHSDATDDEVAEFVASVRRRTAFTAHYHSDQAPHTLPQSDETISGSDIRRQLTEIRRLIMSQTDSLNALVAQVGAISTAVTSAVTELHDLAAKVAALTSNGVVDDSGQLDAISDQLRALAANLTQGVADAAGVPAPVEPAQ